MAGFQKIILNGKEVSKLFINGKQCFPLVLENQNRNLMVDVTTLTDSPGVLSLRVDLTYDGPEVDLSMSNIDGNGNWGSSPPSFTKHSNYSATITFYNTESTPLPFDLIVSLPAENGYLAASYDAPYEIKGAETIQGIEIADVILDDKYAASSSSGGGTYWRAKINGVRFIYTNGSTSDIISTSDYYPSPTTYAYAENEEENGIIPAGSYSYDGYYTLTDTEVNLMST